jgi:Anti-sigma-K factor rskA
VSDQLEPELERIARMLAKAGPLPDAPAALRERTLALPDGAAEALPETGNVVPIARRARRRPRTSILAGIAAVAAAIVIVPTVVIVHGGSDNPEHVALDPRGFAPKGAGSASVATHGDGSATIAMRVWGLPAQSAGRTYEAWLGRVGDRRPLGTFSTKADGTANVSFRLTREELNSYKWLWVTSEPTGGSAQPSTHTALWGALT